jgi:hypothetical protein
MVLTDKKQEVAVGGDGRPQFRQIRIDVFADVFDLYDRFRMDHVFFLRNQFDGRVGGRLGRSGLNQSRHYKKGKRLLHGVGFC